VTTENFLINDGGNGKAVEAVGECLPEFDVVPSLTFIIEAVDSIDGGAFVISSEKEEVLRILNLIGEEEADCLKRLLSSIYVIS